MTLKTRKAFREEITRVVFATLFCCSPFEHNLSSIVEKQVDYVIKRYTSKKKSKKR